MLPCIWPFFSLAKSRRSAPIDFAMGATWISVEAVAEHGMATIWDADILIWAASQLVEALGREGFAAAWLQNRSLAWAAELLPPPPPALTDKENLP